MVTNLVIKQESWEKTKHHCPRCAALEVWALKLPDDHMEGGVFVRILAGFQDRVCAACGAEFTLTLRDRSASAERLRGLRGGA